MDARRWLVLFFLNLTSPFLSLASSWNNLIPNQTTASPSHGGTSSTHQVADESISVRVNDVLAPLPSANGSWLMSFFLNLTSRVPSLASSCNNPIPNQATASASPRGTSPTHQPVVEESISVRVEDVPAPPTDGARRSQVRTFNSSQPSAVHPIAVLFQRQELGKAVLGFVVPMNTGLFFNQYQGLTHLQAGAIAIALSIGFATTWNGMLLHGIWPRVARALEHFGVVTILVAFFGLVSSFLPPWLAWACWLCCGLSCLPFLLCLVLPAGVNEESSAERLDPGIV